MARLSFRCDDELVKRVDAAREHEPREHWLRRAVEQALGGTAGRSDVPESSPSLDSHAGSILPPAPAEQPVTAEVGPDFDPTAPLPAEKVKDLRKRVQGAKRARVTQPRSEPVPEPPVASQDPTGASSRYRQSVPGPNVENIRSSTQVKDFKPYPKGGKRSS